MSDRVLVTGGTGFVAGWCIAELLDRGYAVRATVRDAAKEHGVRAAIAGATKAARGLEFAHADLTRDGGWDDAMAGVDYVLHVASPLGAGGSRDRQSLVEPARGGTIRVLRAATRAGVKRVVVTSAAAAARTPIGTTAISDESVWADPDDPRFDAYRVSKVLAERAAWDFMRSHAGVTSLTTILPGAVFGPLLRADNLGSVQIVRRLLEGKPPGLPRLGFSIVDVRDLAALHVRAMVSPEAAGQRFLAAGDFMWMEDIARTLRSRLGERASRVPTRRLPDGFVRMLSWFLPPLRSFTPDLGRKNALTAEKARRVLGFSPRPAADTIIDCANSLN